ncbi:MAG: hypothetical protein QM477_09090 [Planctomycetota bacterium]
MAILLCGGMISCATSLRNETLIVPGNGVGPYDLGVTTREEVLADGHSLEEKDPQKLRFEFQFDEEDRLEYISVHAPGWETASGIGVGSSLGDMLQAYPVDGLIAQVHRDAHVGYIYWYPGILFGLKQELGQLAVHDIFIMRFPPEESQPRGR